MSMSKRISQQLWCFTIFKFSVKKVVSKDKTKVTKTHDHRLC